MDELDYKNISEVIMDTIKHSENNGVMHGNTGFCIFFYHLARYTNNSEYELFADDLLDKVFANLSASISSITFENGLAGIGWGIEYLVQNVFIEGNTDEILEEVDNRVFWTLNEDKYRKIEFGEGLSGYLFYLIYRLKNKKMPFSMAQRINRELLILIINNIYEQVTSQFSSIVEEKQFDLFWRFPVVLYGLIEAYKLNVCNDKIRCMITQWIPYFEAYIPSMHINRLYMATILSLVNTQFPNKRIEKQIQILIFATDFETLKTELDPNTLNIRFGWSGIVLLLYKASQIIPATSPNYQLIGSTRIEIIRKYKCTLGKIQTNDTLSNYNQLEISEGLAGIGLVNLLWPEALNYKVKAN
jgi:hypothetical protein